MVQLVGTKQLPPPPPPKCVGDSSYVLLGSAQRVRWQNENTAPTTKTGKWQESLIKLLHIKIRPSKQNFKMYVLLFYARERERVTALYSYELSHKVVECIWKWQRRPEKCKVSLVTVLGLQARLIWRVIHTVKSQTNSLYKHKSTISWILRNTTQFRQPLINFP